MQSGGVQEISCSRDKAIICLSSLSSCMSNSKCGNSRGFVENTAETSCSNPESNQDLVPDTTEVSVL